MNEPTPEQHDAFARQFEQLSRLVVELTAVRDVLLEPVRPSGSNEADRQAYAGTMAELVKWCDERDMSFPLTVQRLALLLMRKTPIDPDGKLAESIDHIAGIFGRRLAEREGRADA